MVSVTGRWLFIQGGVELSSFNRLVTCSQRLRGVVRGGELGGFRKVYGAKTCHYHRREKGRQLLHAQ